MRKSVLVLLLFLAMACSNPSAIPHGVIKRNDMVKILWDMVLAERYADRFLKKSAAVPDVKMETFKMYAQIFQLHHTDKDTFIKSYKFYLNHPDISQAMFDSLAVYANKSRAEIFQPLK